MPNRADARAALRLPSSWTTASVPVEAHESMRRLALALLCLVCSTAATHADDERPATIAEAADAVQAAHAKADAPALQQWAGADQPDPWRVADLLLARGQQAAAAAFAAASVRPDTARLAPYVAAARETAEVVALRKALELAEADVLAGRLEEALLRLTPLDRTGGTVPAWAARDLECSVLAALHRVPEALEVAQALALELRAAGWLLTASDVQVRAGVWRFQAGAFAEAAAAWRTALEIHTEREDDESAAHTWSNLGLALERLEDRAGAGKAMEEAARRFEAAGLPDAAAEAWRSVATRRMEAKELAAARVALERALELLSGRPPGPGRGQVLATLGLVAGQEGEPELALETLREAVKLLQQGGAHAGAAEALLAIGELEQRRGDHVKAREAYGSALALAQQHGARREEAGAWAYQGALERQLGDLDKALELLGRAERVFQGLGAVPEQSATLTEMGELRTARADYAEASRLCHRAWDLAKASRNARAMARARRGLARLHHRVGESPRAVELMQEALALLEGDPAQAAWVRLDLGAMLAEDRAHHDQARQHYEEARGTFERLADVAGQATVLARLADLHVRMLDLGEAQRALDASQPLMRALKNRLGALGNEITQAELYLARGDPGRALEELEKARSEAKRLGALDARVWTHQLIAKARLAMGRADLALETANGAVPFLQQMAQHLGDGQGASTRARFAELYATGLQAAAAMNDVRSVLDWLESSRAGALLETLGGAAALQAAALAPELRALRADAAGREEAAYKSYLRELEHGTAASRNSARERFDAAQLDVSRTAERIMGESKARARVLYQDAATEEEIRAALQPGEALVEVGRAGGEAIAVIVEPDRSRLVRLGPWVVLENLCAQLRVHDKEADPEPGIAALRTWLAERLALGTEVRRVLLSPEGALAFVPLAVLLADKQVAYVPSGTALCEIASQRAERGKRVLAIGNPAERPDDEARAPRLLATRRRWPVLTGSREEVAAVGDVPLVGAEATLAHLERTLGLEPRWRALHIACHGFVDVARPELSALVLMADEADDGYLTPLKVVRLGVHADLAVLSACETGLGSVVPGEGLFGLTRAFMLAGTPRVICSLWKVDDQATRALMEAFYERWEGRRPGGKPLAPDAPEPVRLPVAEALRAAQDHVRSHPKWRHPHYWAAWVLWGLPE
jgi:tetratricopeptide (TPR) repeat protein